MLVLEGGQGQTNIHVFLYNVDVKLKLPWQSGYRIYLRFGVFLKSKIW